MLNETNLDEIYSNGSEYDQKVILAVRHIYTVHVAVSYVLRQGSMLRVLPSVT